MKKKTIFWSSADRVAVLRALLEKLVGRGKPVTSAEVLLGELVREFPPGELPRRSRTLRDFITDDRYPKDDRCLSHLLRWSVQYVHKNGPAEIREHADFADAERLLADLDREATGVPLEDVEHPSPKLIAQTRRVALMYLQRKAAEQEALNDKLFAGQEVVRDSSGRRSRRYLCYRYHSTPGMVVKSLLEFKEPPTPGHLFTEFECEFSHGRHSTRHASGWVLAMGKSVYLLGEIDRGAGLKVIAVPNLEAGHDSYPGLILALDEDSSVVAARCVLIPLAPDEDAGPTGILNERTSDDKRLSEYKSQFKNRTKFTLDEDLLFEGRPIDQDGMVHEVRRLLGGKFTYKDSGIEFNPAATRHYTFNVALRKHDLANDN